LGFNSKVALDGERHYTPGLYLGNRRHSGVTINVEDRHR
jgi:hypothetical protein